MMDPPPPSIQNPVLHGPLTRRQGVVLLAASWRYSPEQTPCFTLQCHLQTILDLGSTYVTNCGWLLQTFFNEKNVIN